MLACEPTILGRNVWFDGCNIGFLRNSRPRSVRKSCEHDIFETLLYQVQHLWYLVLLSGIGWAVSFLKMVHDPHSSVAITAIDLMWGVFRIVAMTLRIYYRVPHKANSTQLTAFRIASVVGFFVYLFAMSFSLILYLELRRQIIQAQQRAVVYADVANEHARLLQEEQARAGGFEPFQGPSFRTSSESPRMDALSKKGNLDGTTIRNTSSDDENAGQTIGTDEPADRKYSVWCSFPI